VVFERCSPLEPLELGVTDRDSDNERRCLPKLGHPPSATGIGEGSRGTDSDSETGRIDGVGSANTLKSICELFDELGMESIGVAKTFPRSRVGELGGV
jgi:hypothetical protein